MSEKLNIARLKKFGQTFELSVDTEAALRYKKGEADLLDVLLADKIFSDVRKGLVVSQTELQKAFGTTVFETIADKILKEGEIQVTSEHRAEEREQKRRKLITMIHQNVIDPRTNLPHPPSRIEAALEQGKIHLDDHKSVEEQFDPIISKLRPIIPIRIEQKKMIITIPPQYAGKANQPIRAMAKILSETWGNDGSRVVRIEISGGLQQEFIDTLNSLTHGTVVVDIEK